jgi:hypothetical protein
MQDVIRKVGLYTSKPMKRQVIRLEMSLSLGLANPKSKIQNPKAR